MDDKRDPIGSWSIKNGLSEILRESCDLMARQGFHGTSMRDLAEATGRSLSGLYHYFRSKEDLLFLINYYGFSTLNANWQKIVATFDRPYERLYGFIFFHTTYFIEHMAEMRVMTWGTQALTHEKANIIIKLKDSYTDAARRIVQDCATDMGVQISDRALWRKTYILFGMMNWMFSWYSQEEHGNVSDLVTDIFETFMHGLVGGAADPAALRPLEEKAKELCKVNRSESMWESAGGKNAG